jgi:predicted RNA-binding protein with PUA-like domain
MHYWLIKSEPTTYSWSQFELDKTATWDGVRNFQARNNLKEMNIHENKTSLLQIFIHKQKFYRQYLILRLQKF